MIVFPNCKINLGLSIIGKRNDGYHNVETIFYPVSVKDILEITTLTSNELLARDRENHHIQFSTSGLPVEGAQNDNLCIKAYHLLKTDFSELPALKMHLHKVIPMGAGLGGGSSDGAFTLRLLNEKFHLNLTTRQLIDYAIKLGSDCPFFIINKPCFATSRGEIMETITLDLSKYSFMLVNPGIHINTGWAFEQSDFQKKSYSKPYKPLKEIIFQPVDSWKEFLFNDFEKPVFEKYPDIKKIKGTFYQQGALYAAMSGSGSTVFGIFQKNQSALKALSEHLKNNGKDITILTID